MGLFTQEPTTDGAAVSDEPRRVVLIHEKGTRNLLILLGFLLAGYIAYSKVYDSYLLRQHWGALKPDIAGLTVVGTLDHRETLDHNMFKIYQANKTVRVDLTEYGWRTIFNNNEGPLFSEKAGDAVQNVINVNGLQGFTMLEPYLRAGVARLRGEPNANALVSAAMPIPVITPQGKITGTEPLGELLGQNVSDEKNTRDKGGEDRDSGGSASGRQVDHGLALPGDVLAKTCPVVLTTGQFTGAKVLPQPDNLLTDKTFDLELGLTPEGRSRFYQWSREHANENLVFVLNGRVMAAGKVAMTMNADNWEITNIRDAQAANDLAAYVNAHTSGGH